MDLDYDAVKDSLRVRLVNDRSNREILKGSVSMPAGCGYSLIPYINVEMDGTDGAMIRITRELAEKFGYDEEQVMVDAMNGSRLQDGVRLWRIYDAGAGGEMEDLLSGVNPGEEIDYPLVLSNRTGVLGAAALFMPGIQERIAETVRGGYSVLPSSVHEVLIIPDRMGMTPKDLAGMVMEVNESAVDPEERLGARVLRYDPQKKSLSVAADLERNRSRAAER